MKPSTATGTAEQSQAGCACRIGGFRYPEERFPDHGYVPQGFTHGTLVARDMNVKREFLHRSPELGGPSSQRQCHLYQASGHQNVHRLCRAQGVQSFLA